MREKVIENKKLYTFTQIQRNVEVKLCISPNFTEVKSWRSILHMPHAEKYALSTSSCCQKFFKFCGSKKKERKFFPYSVLYISLRPHQRAFSSSCSFCFGRPTETPRALCISHSHSHSHSPSHSATFFRSKQKPQT